MCPQSYFLSYVLGLPQPDNKKAEMGTVVHKVMECLAAAKKAIQDGKNYIDDDVIGHLEFKDDLVFKDGFVDYIQEKSYNYYSSKSPNEWAEADRKKCRVWTYEGLTCCNGAFDPRKYDILHPELSFDFEIDEPWADYSYKMANGEVLTGKLRMKGTIDLVVDAGDGIVESIDWKGLPVDTLLPTIDGFKRMGNVKIGDILFDINGNTTKVLAKSEKSFKECYKIYFDDKSSVTCDNEHLWLLQNNKVKCITDLKVGDTIAYAKPLENEYVRHLTNLSMFSSKGKVRTILVIEKLSVLQETQCISVDSPTKTYLCTENFIPTHNTGQRIDWGSSKDWPHNIKTYEKLLDDPQLRIYHYALSKVFPDAKQIIPTIYFINNHGTKLKPVPSGAFTLPFSQNDIPRTKEIIRKRFEEIKKCKRPHLNKTWRCSRLCHFGKTKHPSGELNRWGEQHTICSYISEQNRLIGIDNVVKEFTHGNHNVGNYKAPGT